MPRKRNDTSTTSATNGENSKNKKQRLDASDVYESDDEEGSILAQPTDTAKPKMTGSPIAFNEALLKAIESVASGKESCSKFDFGRLDIDGFTPDQLRAQYERLRSAAFRNVRRLSLSKEVRLIREYGHSEMVKGGEKLKRIPSAYFRFMEVVRPKLTKKHPELKLSELTKLAAEKWRNLSDEKKKPYQEAYEREKADRDRLHPKEQKSTKVKSRAKNRPSKNRPPKSAFELFSEAKTKEYGEKYELNGAELTQKLASKFGKLSDKKRQKWENRAREAMDEYVNTLASIDGSQKDAATEPRKSNADSEPKAGTSKNARDSWLFD